MEIVRDNRRAEEFWDFIYKMFTKVRDLKPDEAHVSELMAPRKAYWTRILGERVSDKMIGLFATGEAFHLMFQHAIGEEYAEVQVRHSGVVGTQDVLPPDGEVTEIKTSRKWSVPEDPEPRYIDQLTAYMAMSDKPIGHVLVLYLTAGRKWDGSAPSALELVSWRVELTKQERTEIRAALVSEKDRLFDAIKQRKPEMVDLCPDWMCANIYKGEVKDVCPYYEDCKPKGRYPLTVLIPLEKPKSARKTRGKR